MFRKGSCTYESESIATGRKAITCREKPRDMALIHHPLHGGGKGGAGKPPTPVKPNAKPRTGKDFGGEGTNKTIPVPKPDNAAPEELGVTPHVEKSPYTRG